MADRDLRSPLGPTAVPPERYAPVWEGKIAPNAPGGRGPLRFEEGIATDTDIPNEFVNGIMQGSKTTPRGHNINVYEKWPDETLKERAHLGSAAWTESVTYTGDFAAGAGPEAEVRFIQCDRGDPNPEGQYWRRVNPARIAD